MTPNLNASSYFPFPGLGEFKSISILSNIEIARHNLLYDFVHTLHVLEALDGICNLQIEVAAIAFEQRKLMAYTGAAICDRGLSMDFLYPE